MILDALVAVGAKQKAFKLMDSCNQDLLKGNSAILGIYIDLLADQDEEKAERIIRDLDAPRPSEMFQNEMVDEHGLTEEDCL